MLAYMRSTRVVAGLVVLSLVGAVGMGLPKAQAWIGPVLIPQKAFNPTPADGATGVIPEDVVLTWSAGQGAVLHSIYFGTDEALVAGGSPTVYRGTQPGTTFCTGLSLAAGTTYYWRVDEVDGLGMKVPGSVWCFTTCYYWRVDE